MAFACVCAFVFANSFLVLSSIWRFHLGLSCFLARRTRSDDEPACNVNGTDHIEDTAVLAPEASICAHLYADKTLDMLKAQVRASGRNPVQFITLPQLKADVASLMTPMAGEAHDEARPDVSKIKC